MDLPDVKVAQDENLKGAVDRISSELQLAGNAVDVIGGDDFHTALLVESPSEKGVVFVCTQAWTDEREDALLSKASNIVMAGGLEPLTLKLASAYSASDTIAYFLADAKRFQFSLRAGKIVQQGNAINAQNVPALAKQMLELWAQFYKDAVPGGGPLERIDNFFLSILRTERDATRPDNGNLPLSAVLGMGCVAGQFMSELLKLLLKVDCKWVDHGEDILLDIGVFEKKGFFGGQERRTLLCANPIQKAVKLFKNGSEDSLDSMFRGAAALINQQRK
jgi:hypothetical protein